MMSSSGDDVKDRHYSFKKCDKEYEIFRNRDVAQLLEKWGLKDNLKLQRFTFDERYVPSEKNSFLLDLFHSSDAVECVTNSTSLSEMDLKQIAKCQVELVPCTVKNLEFFSNRLSDSGSVRENGMIVKCFDEYVDDIIIADELRKVLLLEDSESYCVFDPSDRLEFIFRLFKHLVIGGTYCQYEDCIYPYYKATKTLYKDLLCVRKDAENKLQVKSEVLKVVCQNKEGAPIYPSKKLEIRDFAYAVVDATWKTLSLLHHTTRQSKLSIHF